MMDGTEPDEDELRIRNLLKERGVGPDAEPWWESELDTDDDADELEAEDDDERAPWLAPQPDYWPRPHTPVFVTTARTRAEAAISPGTRRLLYNASAAGTGWLLGLYHQFAAALTDCATSYSISGALVLGAGGSLLLAHFWDRRTRHWWPGIAWAARIPLATALLALALWAPAAP